MNGLEEGEDATTDEEGEEQQTGDCERAQETIRLQEIKGKNTKQVGKPTMAMVGFSKMARTTPRTMAQPRLVERAMVADPFKPCGLFSHRFRVQTSANVVHATWCEDRTPHWTHHSRIFSCFSTRDSCARLFANAWPFWLKFLMSLRVSICIFSKVILSSHVSSHAWSP